MKTLFVVLLTIAATASADETIRCESNNGRRNDCRMDESGRVTLTRQLSKNACIEGDTWGVDRNSIWVDRGCRAEFSVSTRRYGGGGGASIVCESDGRRRRCSADTHNGVRMTRQISRAECIEGRTWGFDNNGIWVDDGCRAEFTLGRRGGRRDDIRAETVVCESDYNHREFCRADTRYGVRLARQLSKTSCTYNRTWGYDDRGIWVSDGCRAEFTLSR